MSLKNLRIVAFYCMAAMVFVGCVDLPEQAPEFPDFRTNTRFVQADGSLGATQVLVEPTTDAGFQPTAAVDFMNASDYIDIAAGNRRMQVQGQSDTTTLALATDANNTVVIFPVLTQGGSRFRSFLERLSYQSVVDSVGTLRVISAGLDATGGGSATYDVVDNADGSILAAAVAFRGNSGYMALPPGDYSLGVALSGTTDILATLDVSISGGGSWTAVIFGEPSALNVEAFADRILTASPQ